MEQKLLKGLSQLATFLGGKLDGLSTTFSNGFQSLSSDIKNNKQTVTLSLNSEAVDALRDATKESLDKVTLALTNVTEVEGKHLKELVDTLQQIEKSVRADVADGEALRKQMMKVADLIGVAEMILAKMPKEVSYAKELSAILTAIKAIKLEEKPTDLTPVVKALQANGTALSELKAAIRDSDAKSALALVLEAIKGLKIEVPKTLTVKIDDTQIRSLRSGGGGGGYASRVATNVSIVNVDMPLAETEYSFTFPANTVAWVVKTRAQGTLLHYAFTTGKLPISGDGSAYATVPQNFLQSQSDVEWSGKTIYLQTEKIEQLVEIISYTL